MKIMNENKESFDYNWQKRNESLYTHWARGKINNQIQLAFRNHWEIFQILMKSSHYNKGRNSLEVGCGRGSLSAYFSDAGFKCTLLDISPSVIDIAKQIFSKNALHAQFIVGDVYDLPFDDNSFDIVFSIGLLEHLEDVEKPMWEQVRVLEDGGLFITYVVPENKNNIQREYQWMNNLLGYYSNVEKDKDNDKQEIFRTDKDSRHYLDIMKNLPLVNTGSSGVYPLPMISHSIEFPFTLMRAECEKIVVDYFQGILARRKNLYSQHPWFCDESYGQAFLVWGYKKK